MVFSREKIKNSKQDKRLSMACWAHGGGQWLLDSCVFTCAVDSGANFCLILLGGTVANEAQIGFLVSSPHVKWAGRYATLLAPCIWVSELPE